MGWTVYGGNLPHERMRKVVGRPSKPHGVENTTHELVQVVGILLVGEARGALHASLAVRSTVRRQPCNVPRLDSVTQKQPNQPSRNVGCGVRGGCRVFRSCVQLT